MLAELPLIVALLAERISAFKSPERMIRYEENEPLVQSSPSSTPLPDPDRFRVIYFVNPADRGNGDVPLPELGEGMRVRTENVDLYTAEYSIPGQLALLVCRRRPPEESTWNEAVAGDCQIRE